MLRHQLASITRWPLLYLQPRFASWIAAVGRVYLGLLAAWLLSMIGLPIAKWTFGSSVVVWGVPLSTVLQAMLVTWVLAQAWGVGRALATAALVGVATLLIEAVGTATGLPFGEYSYTGALQPQLLHVPLLIPLAWLMMLPVVWAVARQISGEAAGWRFVLVSAAAMTAWDLFLDPQMVAWGFWVWHEPGGYFGIPWINFAGWFVTAATVTLLVRPRPIPLAPLLPIFGIVWFLETFGLLFFWNLPGPALVGGVAMGSLLVLASSLRLNMLTRPVVGRRSTVGDVKGAPVQSENVP